MIEPLRKIRNGPGKKMPSANVLPIVLELSSDLLTPVSAYLRLSVQGAQAFLLESVEGGERLARYSFLGVNPFLRLAIRDGKLHRTDSQGRTTTLAGNPMTELGKQLSAYRSAGAPGLPPFSGGAVGYVGFECFRYLENVPVPEERDSPYDAYLMLFRNVVAFDHVRHRMVLISNIFLEEEGMEAGRRRAERDLKELRNALDRPSPEERPLRLNADAPEPENFRARMGREQFCAAVSRAKQYIRSGDIFQCVLSEQFSFPLSGSPFPIYRALRNVSPAPYLFYLAMDGETLLGASPELLTKCEAGRVETCPIAGTRPRGRDPREDRKLEASLLASHKERAEHLMLVDLGRNDLGRISRSKSVAVRDFMRVERFSHVMHLVSNVEGKLKRGLSGWDALSACFPAGTLSGAPKIRAVEIISELEPAQRGPYGGAVVYSDFSGRLDSCIAIRSLFVRDGVGHIRAGAGIVADSRPEREYQEVLNKSKALRRAVAQVVAI